MDEVKDVLRTILHDLVRKHKELDYEKTNATWKKIVGSKAACHTKIVYLTKDKIRVNVDSSAWLYELNLKKPHIQKELNRIFKIQDIKFKLGEVKQ